MLNFFTGWRRKAGCVLLAIVCALTIGWLRGLIAADTRSQMAVDNIEFSLGRSSLIQLISRDASIAVRRVTSTLPVGQVWNGRVRWIDRVVLRGFQPPKGNSTGDLSISVDADARASEGSPYHWKINSYGFEIGGVTDRTFPLSVFVFRVPYWSIVIPLTFLCAYLLLWPSLRANPEAPKSDDQEQFS